MHIKAVVFRDFKSYYYDGLGGEEFSPLVNCLVGGNGSGKSNFFAGVQFVLGHGKYRTIPVKERKELLHEGAGNKRLSTSVELHLDNSDGRLALDSDSNTVVIQRMLGSKKDEYIVNQRSTSASEVHALLEAAGFSPSNPYNIVEQGRITAFATMRDEDRFELLKQIAGTKVYEDRRLQSLQVLEQAERDMARIDSNIQNIDGRLNELGEEREEFKAHQQLERRHRCLQYCIHKKEADTAMAALKEAEETLASQTNSAQALMDKIHETSKDLKALEKKAAQASLTVQQQKRQRDLILQERSGWVKRQARLEVSLNAAETEQKEDQLLKAKTEQSLAAVLAEIRKKDAQLEKEARELNELETVAEKSRAEVANLAAQVDFLITKRGRHNQFSTRVDRDKWLTTEVAKQQKTLAVYEKEKEKLEATKVDIPKRVAAILHEIEKKRSTLSIE
ncbi:Chromosome segregation protein sudA, partial [Diplonema papillatum]